MKDLVFICSPYRGSREKNIENVRRYCLRAVQEDYIPIAPHLYFTQFLNDDNILDRANGLQMGKDLMELCSEMWVFADEVTEGMIEEIRYANEAGIEITFYDSEEKEINNEYNNKKLGDLLNRIITKTRVTDKSNRG